MQGVLYIAAADLLFYSKLAETIAVAAESSQMLNVSDIYIS